LKGSWQKKSDSVYTPGLRTKEWLKIKVNQRQEVVIGGFTKNDDTSKAFSALLVGVYKGTELNYIGKIGTGLLRPVAKRNDAAVQAAHHQNNSVRV
jgi:bifunctional non-homologous end joining protein LigD